MELILFFGILLFLLALMLIGLKWEPFICLLSGFIGILLAVAILNDGYLTETLSGFSTPIGIYIWLPIGVVLVDFILGIKVLLSRR